jgi:glycosyltransferase involved in cell wall biosynthesis
MVGDDFEFDVITGSGDLPEYLSPMYNVYPVATPERDLAGLGYALRGADRYLRSRRPDLLLNAARPFPLGVAAVFAGRWHGVKTLLRITGDFLNEASIYNNPLERWKQYLTHNVLLASIYRLADHVVAIGPNLASALIEHGFSAAKVQGIYQPFDAQSFAAVDEAKKRDVRKQLGLDPTRPTMLFVGRLTWGKGADRLYEIVERVREKNSEIQFCLVGPGAMKDRFEVFGDGVHLPGYVPRQTVHRYFQAADLLIHPSRTEGCPHVILEALACEVPVIASPVGEIDTVISTTTEQVGDYVDYILGRDWHLDPLPESLDWERQTQRYRELLNCAAS